MEVKVITRIKGALLPERMTENSSGYDLYANYKTRVWPMKIETLLTGLRMEIPQGYEGQIRIRSSMAKEGLILVNGVGTIDSDYRGEIKLLLSNIGNAPVDIDVGTRVAQIVFAPVMNVEFKEVDSLSETDRGSGGFGSTGGTVNG